MDNQMSNPVVIMLINMTIVFAVLFLLSLFIRVIHFIDPTKPRTKKKTHPTAAPAKPKKAAPAKAAEPAAPVVAPGISGYCWCFGSVWCWLFPNQGDSSG